VPRGQPRITATELHRYPPEYLDLLDSVSTWPVKGQKHSSQTALAGTHAHTHTHTHAHSNSTRTRPVPQRRPEPRVQERVHPPRNRTPTAAAAAATAHIRGVIQQQHLSHERTVRTRSTATAAAAKFPYAATTRTEQSLSSFRPHTHVLGACYLVTKTLGCSSKQLLALIKHRFTTSQHIAVLSPSTCLHTCSRISSAAIGIPKQLELA